MAYGAIDTITTGEPEWQIERWAMKKTTIYLTEGLDSELDALSRRKHRPKADLIREALSEYIHDEQPALPRWIGMIKDDDGSLRSDNVDEWLKENWHPE